MPSKSATKLEGPALAAALLETVDEAGGDELTEGNQACRVVLAIAGYVHDSFGTVRLCNAPAEARAAALETAETLPYIQVAADRACQALGRPGVCDQLATALNNVLPELDGETGASFHEAALGRARKVFRDILFGLTESLAPLAKKAGISTPGFALRVSNCKPPWPRNVVHALVRGIMRADERTRERMGVNRRFDTMRMRDILTKEYALARKQGTGNALPRRRPPTEGRPGALRSEDLQIMATLERQGLACTIIQLSRQIPGGLGRVLVGQRVKKLKDAELVYHPEGPRRGICLTDAGREKLRVLTNTATGEQ